MEGYIGGIALPTNVTLGKCIPSMLCVVDVYLTGTVFLELLGLTNIFACHLHFWSFWVLQLVLRMPALACQEHPNIAFKYFSYRQK